MISVIAKIDKSSRARLSWIQSFAASFGIVPKPICGHITLAAIDEALIPACKDALAGQKAVTVDFEKVDIVDGAGAVAALAAPEGALDALRGKLAAVGPLEDGWIPRIVLLRDNMVNLNWVHTAMSDMFKPFTATVDRIEFMDGAQIVDGLDLEVEV